MIKKIVSKQAISSNRQRLIYKGRTFSLVNRKSLLPNGRCVSADVIIHPGAAVIVPFLTKDTVLLLRQFRVALERYLYEAPAGTRKESESFLTCAQRETEEETGFSASQFTCLGSVYPVPGYSTEKLVMYKAEGLEKSDKKSEADEVIQVRAVTKKKAKELFTKRKITDAKTICALAMCGWL